jgi:hypothetical protein
MDGQEMKMQESEMKGPSEDTGGPWEMEVIRGDSGEIQGSGRGIGRHRKIQERYREKTGRFEEDTNNWRLEESMGNTGTYSWIVENTRSYRRSGETQRSRGDTEKFGGEIQKFRGVIGRYEDI